MNVFMKNSSFRRLMYSNILNNLGTTLFNIVFLIYASKMPNPTLAVSAVSIIGALPFMTDVISGYMADHTKQVYNKILFSRFVQIILFLILSFFIGINHSWILFGIILIINFLSDFLGSYSSYLTLPIFKHIVEEDDLSEARGFTGGIRQSIELVGGMLGASLLALLNQSFVFFGILNSITFLLSFLIFKFNVKIFDFKRTNSEKVLKSKNKKKNFIQDIKTNFQNLEKYPQIFHFTLLFSIMNFIGASQEVLIALTLLKIKELVVFNYGFTIALIGAVESGGIILGSFIVFSYFKKMSIETSVAIEMLMTVLFIVNITLFKNPIVMLGCLFLNGYMLGISNPKIDSFIMKVVPESQLGMVMSSFYSLITITIPVGSMVAASLGNFQNIIYPWILLLIIGIFGFGYSLKLLKDYRTFA